MKVFFFIILLGLSTSVYLLMTDSEQESSLVKESKPPEIEPTVMTLAKEPAATAESIEVEVDQNTSAKPNVSEIPEVIFSTASTVQPIISHSVEAPETLKNNDPLLHQIGLKK